jgi:hypothetical protein
MQGRAYIGVPAVPDALCRGGHTGNGISWGRAISRLRYIGRLFNNINLLIKAGNFVGADETHSIPKNILAKEEFQAK